MYQAVQWVYKLLFTYFPQQIYQVNIYSFYQLETEKQRNQEMNAFNLKNKRAQHKRVLHDSNRKCTFCHIDRTTQST